MTTNKNDLLHLLARVAAGAALAAGSQPLLGQSSDAPARGAATDEVTVFGRGNATALREVPQTADVFDLGAIDGMQARVVDDVLRFVPNASGYAWHTPLYTSFTIRGFSASQTWNGLAFRWNNAPPSTANVERIEVLKGPASVLYGSMEPGAVVNVVTKRPQDRFHVEGGVALASYDEKDYRIDVGGPLGENVRARLNASYNRTDTPWENAGAHLAFIAPVVEFDLGEATLLTLEGHYDRYHWPNGWTDGGVPFVGGFVPNPLGDVPLDRNLRYDEDIASAAGFTDLVELRKNTDVNLRLAHDLGEHVVLNASLSYHRTYYDEVGIYHGSLDTDNRTVERNYWIGDDDPTYFRIAHFDARAKFDTGRITHDVIVGLDASDQDAEFSDAYFPTTPIDLFAPVYGTIVLPDEIPFDSFRNAEQIDEIFVQDRIAFEQWHFVAGVRVSDYRLDSRFTPFGGDTGLTVVNDTIRSTQLGVLYDIGDRTTIYASRNESFVPQTGTTNAGGATIPETGTQHELGAKLALGERDLSLDLALFHIEKNDIFITDPTDPLFQIPIGQVVSKGFEVSLRGQLRPGFTLYAGYGRNDTEITRAEFNVGNRFYDVPKHTLAAFSSYEIQEGPLAQLKITGSAQYVGERYASDDNITLYPSYTRVDLGVSYPLSERIELALHVENVTEAKILDGFGEFDVLRDQFRTWLGEVRVRL